jgi:hypothetical protein
VNKKFVRQVSGALRTGKYKQIYFKLWNRNTNEACVAGVVIQEAGHTEFIPGIIYSGFETWDLPTDQLVGRDGEHWNGLIRLNNDGVTFPQLADLIDYFILGEPCRSGGKVRDSKEVKDVRTEEAGSGAGCDVAEAYEAASR